MAGYRDLVLAIPPILLADLKISTPTTTLSDCRILGNDDPTYGTIGWTPPVIQSGSAFSIVRTLNGGASYPEPNRVWMLYQQEIFVAIAHADTPFVNENFNDQATQWIDQMVQVIPNNSRVLPVGQSVSPVSGDVWWELKRADINERHLIFNSWYYGVKFLATLRVVYSVNYEP